jgi:hypothetical protein
MRNVSSLMRYYKNPKLKILDYEVTTNNKKGLSITNQGLEDMKDSLINNQKLKDLDLSCKINKIIKTINFQMRGVSF